MLVELKARNFRSLRNAGMLFSDTGLNAIVGANGSGKSNLVRCIDFLSSIPRDGLESAIRTHNGIEALMSKAVSLPHMKGTEVSIECAVLLPKPPEYPANGPELRVDYSIVIQAMSSRSCRLKSERIRFAEPVLFELTSGTKRRAQHDEGRGSILGSYLEVARTDDGKFHIEANPSIDESTIDAYLGWFGLPFVAREGFKGDKETVTNRLIEMFSAFRVSELTANRTSRGHLSSMLDRNAASPLSFGRHPSYFRNHLEGIRRYDLQLSQLRRQQDIAAHRFLTVDGRGMPAAINALRSASDRSASWKRITRTLKQLAPHIVDASVSDLKSGQEYINFVEHRTGRAVESWQSSDGTLRALAILLAVETLPPNGVVLIEEPEQGLHPWAVRTLIKHLREVIEQSRIQIILTTHSQQVLDCLDPSEVMVATRSNQTGTTFRPVPEIVDTKDIERGEVGRLWVSGLLSGTPNFEDAVDDSPRGRAR